MKRYIVRTFGSDGKYGSERVTATSPAEARQLAVRQAEDTGRYVLALNTKEQAEFS